MVLFIYFVILLQKQNFDAMNEVKTGLIGTSGIAVAEVATPMLEAVDVSGVVQIIVQVIIGIATIIGLFKKKTKQ